jgi:hypothetical protein
VTVKTGVAGRCTAVQTRGANGRYWARTSDLLLVRQALYQLS